MNEFDKFLEMKLRQVLDPVAASTPPARRTRHMGPQGPILVVAPTAVEHAAEAIPLLERTMVTIPVASAPQL